MAGDWSTKRKVIVGALVAATIFLALNGVFLCKTRAYDDVYYDLATLELVRVRRHSLFGLTVGRKSARRPTPASEALAAAGCETGLRGVDGPRSFGRGISVFDVPDLDYDYLPLDWVTYDPLVVELIRRKGQGGMPTLRRIIARVREGQLRQELIVMAGIWRAVRQDHPDEDWPDAGRPGE